MVLPLALLLLAPAAQPDALVILVDDVGWGLLEAAETPHIDGLMAGGTVFTQAWAYPSCSPARAALLTGRHAFRTGVGAVLKPNKPHERPGLAHAEVTLAEALPVPCDAFGKWHVSYRIDDPGEQGFAHFAGGFWNLAGTGGSGYYDWTEVVDGVRHPRTDYATAATTDRALASDAPVRLVQYHAVHSPPQPPPGLPPGSDYQVTLDMLRYLDREVGRLTADFDGLVVLLADNGTEYAYGGAKGSLKEGGLHVPFVVHGPGVLAQERDDLVSIVDVLATLCELHGVPCPGEDGVSFLPALAGGPAARETIYAERFDPLDIDGTRERAIRDARWKLRLLPDDSALLFRMPGEVLVPPPWTADEVAAAAALRARLPE